MSSSKDILEGVEQSGPQCAKESASVGLMKDNSNTNMESAAVVTKVNVSAEVNDAVSKLVSLWEQKNARRAVNGAGLFTIAVSLAACGGSGDVSDDDYYDINDEDGDGVANALDAFPFDGTEWIDTDGDGIGDNVDPEQTAVLTTGKDIIQDEFDIVEGIVGGADTEMLEVSTFTLLDDINGDGDMHVVLTLAGGIQEAGYVPMVTMSGVDHLHFIMASDLSAEFDASTYGTDISFVTASGANDGSATVTDIVSTGEFHVMTVAPFEGTLIVGDEDFDNSYWGNVNQSGRFDSEENPIYIQGSVQTDLYSVPGVEFNAYIDTPDNADGGNSSVHLYVDEFEVNAGSGRNALAYTGDEVGGHVFHHVELTDDLITAEKIEIGLVDVNVAKGAFGEAVVSNHSHKSSDYGDAQSLGMDIGAVEIDVADVADAIVEFRNIASNTVSGDATTPNDAAHAGDIEVGDVDGVAGTDSSIQIDIQQLAALPVSGADPEDLSESVSVGDVTVGDITVNGESVQGRAASSFDLDIENDITASTTGPLNVFSAAGSVTVGNISSEGFSDVDVEIQSNVSTSMTVGGVSEDFDGTASIGNMSVGDVDLTATDSISVDIDQNIWWANDDATIGNMDIAGITQVSGGRSTAEVNRSATSVDGDARIGTTDIGDVSVTGERTDDDIEFNVAITASAGQSTSEDLTTNAFVGNVNIGDVAVTGIGLTDDSDATFELDVRARALFNNNDVETVARVSNVTVGDVTVTQSEANFDGADDETAYINIDITAQNYGANYGNTPVGVGGDAIIGNVTLGNLTAVIDVVSDELLSGDGANDSDIDIDITANAYSWAADDLSFTSSSALRGHGDASVGDVTVGNIVQTANDNVDFSLDVIAVALSGDAEVGDIVVGSIDQQAMTTGDNNPDADIDVELLAIADRSGEAVARNASIASAEFGDITVNTVTDSGGTFDGDFKVLVSADGVEDDSATATVGMLTIGDVTVGHVDDDNYTFDGHLDVEVTAEVSGTGQAHVTGVNLGQVSISGHGELGVELSHFAIVDNGSATVENVDVTGVSLASSLTADATENAAVGQMLISVASTAVVDEASGDASVDNISVGDIDVTAYNVSGEDSTFDGEAGLYFDAVAVGGDESGSGDVTNVSLGNVNVELSSDVAASYFQHVGVHADFFARGASGSSVQAVEIGDIDVSGPGQTDDVDNGNHVDVTVRVTGTNFATTDTEDAAIVAGDRLISDVVVGDVFVGTLHNDADINIFMLSEVDGSYDVIGDNTARIEDVSVGDLSAVSAFGDADVDATFVADAFLEFLPDAVTGPVTPFGDFLDFVKSLNLATAEVSNVTVGDISAFNVTADIDGSLVADTNTIDLYVGALGVDALVEDVTVGSIDAGTPFGNDVDVNVGVYAGGYPDNGQDLFETFFVSAFKSATIDGVMIGDLSADAAITDDRDGDADIDVSVRAQAMATDALTTASVSINDVTIGNIASSGDYANAEVEVEAVMYHEGNEEFEVSVTNVQIGDISSTVKGTVDGGYADSGNGTSDFSIRAYNPSLDGSRAVAYIDGVTIGDVSSEANVDGGDAHLRGTVLAYGEESSDINDVTIGDLSVESTAINGNVFMSVNIASGLPFFSSYDGLVTGGIVRGDITNVTVGNISASIGEDGDDDGDGVRVIAADDIIDVTLGDVNLSAMGDSALIDELGIDVTAVLGYIDDLTIGDVSVTASDNAQVLLGGTYDALIDIRANEEIGKVTIGDIDLTAGVSSTVDADVNIVVSSTGPTLNFGEDGDIEDINVGTVSVAATGVAALARFDMDVVTDGSLGSVTLDGIDMDASATDARAEMVLYAYGEDNLGGEFLFEDDISSSLDVDSIAMDVAGIRASSYVSLYMEIDEDWDEVVFGQLNVTGDVSESSTASIAIDVYGSHSVGRIDIAQGDLDTGVTVDINVGNIVIDLSNSSDAGVNRVGVWDDDDTGLQRTGADAALNETMALVHGDDHYVTLGDHDDNENFGYADAYVEIDVVANDDGDVTIGNIDLTSSVLEDGGRVNTAGVVADVFLSAHSGNVTIGDVTVVGGYYADSGLEGASVSEQSGIFNKTFVGSYRYDSETYTVVDNDTDGQSNTQTEEVVYDFPTETLRFDEDVRFEFEYDQAADLFHLSNVYFLGVNTFDQFDIVRFDTGEDGVGYDDLYNDTFQLFGDVDYDAGDGIEVNWFDGVGTETAGSVNNIPVNDLLATISFDQSTGMLTIDWADATPDATVKVDFTGTHDLFNDLDSTSFTLDDGFIANEVVRAVDLELLDNFNYLGDESWLWSNADLTDTIGNVDYSGYVAAQTGDRYATEIAATYTIGEGDAAWDGNLSEGEDFAYEVFIDLTGFTAASDGETPHTIKGAQGSTAIVGTDDDNEITAYGGDDLIIGGKGADTMTGGDGADIFLFANEGTIYNLTQPVTSWDVITDFDATEGDKLDFSHYVDAGDTYAEGTVYADLAALLVAAQADGNEVFVGSVGDSTFVVADYNPADANFYNHIVELEGVSLSDISSSDVIFAPAP